MAKFGIFLGFFLFTTLATAKPVLPVFRDVVRCQILEGYEVALQKRGKSYFLALIYGAKTEYRERLTKPLKMSLERDRNHVNFELKMPDSKDYVVKISTSFDSDAASDNEFVHYKKFPIPKYPSSYKLYEMAGDGLPLKAMGCKRI